MNKENENIETDKTTVDTAGKQTEQKGKSGKSTLKRAASGAGTGLLIGGLATVLSGMKASDNPADTASGEPENHPEWADENMHVASGVTDDMSFGEAFTAAREEIGPGGCFEWHGRVYGTYTSEEWNNLSPEERAEFNSRFNWNRLDSTESDVARPAANRPAEESEAQDVNVTPADDSETEPEKPEEPEVDFEDAEIEILGFEHPEEEVDPAVISLDGDDVILVDIDEPTIEDLPSGAQIVPGEFEDPCPYDGLPDPASGEQEIDLFSNDNYLSDGIYEA